MANIGQIPKPHGFKIACFPINIANLEDVQRLAEWKAENDDNVRRVPVKGVPSKGIVGTPGLIKGDPK